VREMMNAETSRTVTHPSQVEDELRYLCEVLRG
jgi:hypothetical protein